MNNYELGNNMGYQCPRCKKGTHLYISATISVEAELWPDGTDNDGGDTEWGENSGASCFSGCGWMGRVKDLIVLTEEDGFDPDGERP